MLSTENESRKTERRRKMSSLPIDYRPNHFEDFVGSRASVKALESKYIEEGKRLSDVDILQADDLVEAITR